MPGTGAFLDTNLLVLLAVGSVGREQVGRHRRTRRFSAEDYDRLLRFVEGQDRVFVTPNTLTEASNLLESRGDARFLRQLRHLIDTSCEVVIASATAAASPHFVQFGLADTALLEAISSRAPLLTVDLSLFAAGLRKGPGCAVRFLPPQVRRTPAP